MRGLQEPRRAGESFELPRGRSGSRRARGPSRALVRAGGRTGNHDPPGVPPSGRGPRSATLDDDGSSSHLAPRLGAQGEPRRLTFRSGFRGELRCEVVRGSRVFFCSSRAWHCHAFRRAQIITENAGVTSPETPELRETFFYLDAEHGREFTWSQQFIYSPVRSDELKLTLPWIDRTLEGSPDLGVSGLGDATLRWKHAFVRDDDVMRSTRWSGLLEVGAPTGDRADSDGGVPLPEDVRLSRGDWSAGAGAAFTEIVDRHRFAAETMFRHWTGHDGFQLGDTLDLNLAYWYRIQPGRFETIEGTTEIRGVLELLSTYRFEAESHGAGVGNEGVLVSIAPGVQVYPRDWLLIEANVQIPIAQTMDDSIGDRNFAAFLGVKVLF